MRRATRFAWYLSFFHFPRLFDVLLRASAMLAESYGRDCSAMLILICYWCFAATLFLPWFSLLIYGAAAYATPCHCHCWVPRPCRAWFFMFMFRARFVFFFRHVANMLFTLTFRSPPYYTMSAICFDFDILRAAKDAREAAYAAMMFCFCSLDIVCVEPFRCFICDIDFMLCHACLFLYPCRHASAFSPIAAAILRYYCLRLRYSYVLWYTVYAIHTLIFTPPAMPPSICYSAYYAPPYADARHLRWCYYFKMRACAPCLMSAISIFTRAARYYYVADGLCSLLCRCLCAHARLFDVSWSFFQRECHMPWYVIFVCLFTLTPLLLSIIIARLRARYGDSVILPHVRHADSMVHFIACRLLRWYYAMFRYSPAFMRMPAMPICLLDARFDMLPYCSFHAACAAAPYHMLLRSAARPSCWRLIFHYLPCLIFLPLCYYFYAIAVMPLCYYFFHADIYTLLCYSPIYASYAWYFHYYAFFCFFFFFFFFFRACLLMRRYIMLILSICHYFFATFMRRCHMLYHFMLLHTLRRAFLRYVLCSKALMFYAFRCSWGAAHFRCRHVAPFLPLRHLIFYYYAFFFRGARARCFYRCLRLRYWCSFTPLRWCHTDAAFSVYFAVFCSFVAPAFSCWFMLFLPPLCCFFAISMLMRLFIMRWYSMPACAFVSALSGVSYMLYFVLRRLLAHVAELRRCVCLSLRAYTFWYSLTSSYADTDALMLLMLLMRDDIVDIAFRCCCPSFDVRPSALTTRHHTDTMHADMLYPYYWCLYSAHTSDCCFAMLLLICSSPDAAMSSAMFRAPPLPFFFQRCCRGDRSIFVRHACFTYADVSPKMLICCCLMLLMPRARHLSITSRRLFTMLICCDMLATPCHVAILCLYDVDLFDYALYAALMLMHFIKRVPMAAAPAAITPRRRALVFLFILFVERALMILRAPCSLRRAIFLYFIRALLFVDVLFYTCADDMLMLMLFYADCWLLLPPYAISISLIFRCPRYYYTYFTMLPFEASPRRSYCSFDFAAAIAWAFERRAICSAHCLRYYIFSFPERAYGVVLLYAIRRLSCFACLCYALCYLLLRIEPHDSLLASMMLWCWYACRFELIMMLLPLCRYAVFVADIFRFFHAAFFIHFDITPWLLSRHDFVMPLIRLWFCSDYWYYFIVADTLFCLPPCWYFRCCSCRWWFAAIFCRWWLLSTLMLSPYIFIFFTMLILLVMLILPVSSCRCSLFCHAFISPFTWYCLPVFLRHCSCY